MPPFTTCVAELVYHTKLHTSQTKAGTELEGLKLVYHKKLHTSQTEANARFSGIKFDNHKNYTPLKLLSMRYPCVVVLQPYKTTQLSNPNIICKKEILVEKAKEKRAK